MPINDTINAARDWFGDLSIVTQVFIVVIFAQWVLLNFRFNAKSKHMGPTLLTTTGIFATFLGVALGLNRFDTTNVQASIPSLLTGLKTAFWASAFGVGAAILLKAREFVLSSASVSESDEAQAAADTTAADLVSHLREIQQALAGRDDGSVISQLKLGRQETNERLAPLRDIYRGLVGSDDGSLIMQLRLLRQDTNDRLDSLRGAMTEAIGKLSEMSSKALIEALRDAIRDFNTKLTEQFGENFKELNNAVGRLLYWQDNYKTTLETTAARLNETASAARALTEDFKTVVEPSERFAKVAQDLASLLAGLDAGELRLKDVAEALAALLLKASDSLPQIEQKVVDLANQMASAVLANQRTVNAALSESTKTISDSFEAAKREIANLSAGLSSALLEGERTVERMLNETTAAMRGLMQGAQQDMARVNAESGRVFQDLVESLKKDTARLAAELASSVDRNQKTVQDALAENAKGIRQSIQAAQQELAKTNSEFNRQLDVLATKTKDQVAVLDRALAEELQKSLQSLAGQLAALSEKFVADYKPLTDRLRQVLEIARAA
jgi:DNA anti-recombination protein RmuC